MFARSAGRCTILTVNGDSATRHVIGRALAPEGHAVLEAPDARTAVELARVHRPDMIILDTSLPDMNGLELCAYLRTLPYVTHTPILFVSERVSAHAVAQALDCGGDDYLRRPFALRELRARVRALLRRAAQRPQATRPVLRLDPQTRVVTINERRATLTATEYDLLDYLCRHADRYHSAHSLLEALWGYAPGSGDTALVRNHIRNLRRKIEADPGHPNIVVSLHGRCYTLNALIEYDTQTPTPVQR